jgi:hypothetical protein
MVTAEGFVRRVNSDSTIDSICLSCYKTVVTVEQEIDLVGAETRHACHPLELDLALYRLPARDVLGQKKRPRNPMRIFSPLRGVGSRKDSLPIRLR